jgi:hypothetical protein
MGDWIKSAVESVATVLALFLEREAGHSIISLTCICVGMWFMDPVARVPAAHDIFLIGIGYLGRGMGSTKNAG